METVIISAIIFAASVFFYHIFMGSDGPFKSLQKTWDVSGITPVVETAKTLNYDGKFVVIKGINEPDSTHHKQLAMALMKKFVAKRRSELTRITVTAEDTCAAAVHIFGVGDLSIKLLQAGLVRTAYSANRKQIEAEIYAKTRKRGIWATDTSDREPGTDEKSKVMAEFDEQVRIWSSFGCLAAKEAQIHRLKRTLEEIDKLAGEGRVEEIQDLIDGIPDVDLEEDIAYMSEQLAAKSGDKPDSRLA